MVYETLNSELQKVALFNYDMFGKFYIFFIIFALSLVYKFYWKPYKQELTAYISIGVMRYLLDKTSTVVLLASPFFVIMMHPAYTLGAFATWFTKLFQVGMTIFLFLFGIDIFRLGVMGMLTIGGVDFKDPTVNKFVTDMKNQINIFK